MAFDGIVLKKVISELNTCLINGKINKIYEPNKNEIVFGIYSNSKNYSLLTNISSNNYRIHLTTNSKPNPLNAPNFCMLLRKHLIGYRIKSINISGLERIVEIKLEGYNELNDLLTKTLVIELMGKHSNIILLNENYNIIDCMRHLDITSGSNRDILPARKYILPNMNKNDIYKTSKNAFINSIDTNNNIANEIATKYAGISNTFINFQVNSIKSNETEILYDKIFYILNNLDNNKTSCIQISEKDYTISDKCFDDILQTNFFLDDFYLKKEENESILDYRNNLLKLVLTALKKISNKISNINIKLKECENMDKYRIYGELITSNLYLLNGNEKKKNISLKNYYDENKIIEIPLDLEFSISNNAKRFFKKYHKLKNTLEIVTIQKQQAEKELDYLESIIYELENSTSISELDEIYTEICENGLFKINSKANIKKNKINKKKTNDVYEPLIYNVDGFDLYVGKNNKQNDYISTKLGKNEDLWFHTKDIRGSHCLLKCNGQKVQEHTILACAQIAAYYSKAKLSSNVPVDYCFIKDVKKPASSKPGMVIYKNNKTLYVNPKVL